MSRVCFFLIFSVFQVVSGLSNPDIKVEIIPELPGPALKVQTFLSKYAPGSKVWQPLMARAEEEFENVNFETMWVTPEDFQDQKSVVLPFSQVIYKGRVHKFKYKDNYRYIRRWIEDALVGRFSLFWNISLADPLLSKEREVYVHVLSPEKPNAVFPNILPEVTFAWTPMKRTKFKNVVIVRGMDGYIRQKYNHSEYKLLHDLLPPIIPNWMLDTDKGQAIFQTFAERVITIVHDGSLESWWYDLAQNYSRTAFVLIRSNETSLRPVSSVWFERRSVQFTIPSVGPEVISWLRGIPRYTTEPTYRASAAPETPHHFLTDVTGSTFWDWLKNASQKVLHVYDESNEHNLEYVFDDLRAENVAVGRMDLTKNDHEYLPLETVPGMCLHFSNMTLKSMNKCEEFDFTLQ